MRPRFLHFVAFTILVFHSFTVTAQKSEKPKKFPSVFWEITGNGLKQPSYLFGTMHVSSKLAFHLSDSFYHAIRSVSTVALELNPDVWQGQMVRMERMKQNYSEFAQGGSDYLTEKSFRVSKFDDELKTALSTEPTVVNSLLYRTYKPSEDFEEDTFLDLYIFQTGKKLGKKATGVEDYNQTEKMITEAYVDMANEKKKKTMDFGEESMAEIQEKLQDAYRRGDLDLMDSLDNLMYTSDAFKAKFLYQRNVIQANSIDTILKKSSLFVGVGAAHLPGDKGVIELLRKMGYTLRPIKMANRDAVQKDVIDKLKVPVEFTQRESDDKFYKVATPGPLFKMTGEYQLLDRRQYSDMSNGSYYLVTRVRTHAAFVGQSEATVMKKIDSLLYENIPGKIIKKTAIKRNGYDGYDILNKTRRGDMQRYNIFVTPFEILIFKISGKEDYVQGKEAEQYFSSIKLKELNNTPSQYKPVQGGFTVKFPQQPNECMNKIQYDGIDRWEFEAIDKTNDKAYVVFKKTVNNYRFLDEDTFDLKLIEESFRSPDFFERQINRKLTSFQGYPALEVVEKMKDSSIITAKFIIQGPHYYAVAARTKDGKADDFLNSFSFAPFEYGSNYHYVDTFFHFNVKTPVKPDVDDELRTLIEKSSDEMMNAAAYASYWPKMRTASFKCDSTGELISVNVQKYPKYFYVKDSARFWQNEINDDLIDGDLVLYKKDTLFTDGKISGVHLILRDTGTSRTMERLIVLKDEYIFYVSGMGDTLSKQTPFQKNFFTSFLPEQKSLGRNIFINNLDTFFNDLFSADSATHANAQKNIANVYYGEKGEPKVVAAINRLKPSDKDYFDTKTKLIAELGYIKDTTTHRVVGDLKKIYEQTADTSLFQNEVVEALVRHKTLESVNAFKEIVMQDPPVYSSTYEYEHVFNLLEDSLELARKVFPDFLQLTTLTDYKDPVISLLVTLVDSGHVKAADYEDYFSKIYFDAKIELKKQQGKDENKMKEESNKDEEDEYARVYSYGGYNSDLANYAVLLAPFYDKNPNVPKYLNKLLHSREESVQLNAIITLLKNKKDVPDSVINAIADVERLRGRLYYRLEKIKRLDKFPAKYKNQVDIARSYLIADKQYKKMDSVMLIGKETASYDDKQGYVYFFKYRVKKDEDWKIGLSGLQPKNLDETSSDDEFSTMTDKKVDPEKPELEQFQDMLKRMLFAKHKSGKYFFDNNSSRYGYGGYND